MTQYTVLGPCVIDGVTYKGGEIIDFDVVPEGSWPSVRLLGLLVEVPVDPATPDDANVSQDANSKKGKK